MESIKYRNYKNGKVAWFGSFGKDVNGNKIPASNYLDQQAGISSTLTQQLSVIRNELWYNIRFGMPIISVNPTSKLLIDSYISNVIYANSEVVNITKFESHVANEKYMASLVILTKYGAIEMQI